MSSQQRSTRQRVTSPFVLDGPKLSRIVEVIEERFQDRETDPLAVLTARLDKGRSVECSSAEELLALDNSVTNPVRELEIRFENSGGEECVVLFDSDTNFNILLDVRSNDSRWRNQTYAAIEEQVERSYQRSPFYHFRRSEIVLLGVMGLLLAVLIGMLSILILATPRVRSVALTTDEAKRLLDMSKEISSPQQTQEFLLEFHRTELEGIIQHASPKGSLFEQIAELKKAQLGKYLAIGLPVLVLFGSGLYLVMWCYPFAVFAWGDQEDWLGEVTSRRKMTWNVVIISLLIGVVSNLFVLGVTGF